MRATSVRYPRSGLRGVTCNTISYSVIPCDACIARGCAALSTVGTPFVEILRLDGGRTECFVFAILKSSVFGMFHTAGSPAGFVAGGVLRGCEEDLLQRGVFPSLRRRVVRGRGRPHLRAFRGTYKSLAGASISRKAGSDVQWLSFIFLIPFGSLG